MAKVASITGVKDLVKNLAQLEKGTKKQLRKAIVVIAKQKLAISQERVPVKSGKLKATGRASVRVGAKQLTAKLIYGSDEVKYAARIHEDLTLRHPRGGQSKYVESVINETDFAAEVAASFDLAAAIANQGQDGGDEEIKP
jgi:hypothetical protein